MRSSFVIALTFGDSPVTHHLPVVDEPSKFARQVVMIDAMNKPPAEKMPLIVSTDGIITEEHMRALDQASKDDDDFKSIGRDVVIGVHWDKAFMRHSSPSDPLDGIYHRIVNQMSDMGLEGPPHYDYPDRVRLLSESWAKGSGSRREFHVPMNTTIVEDRRKKNWFGLIRRQGQKQGPQNTLEPQYTLEVESFFDHMIVRYKRPGHESEAQQVRVEIPYMDRSRPCVANGSITIPFEHIMQRLAKGKREKDFVLDEEFLSYLADLRDRLPRTVWVKWSTSPVGR